MLRKNGQFCILLIRYSWKVEFLSGDFSIIRIKAPVKVFFYKVVPMERNSYDKSILP